MKTFSISKILKTVLYFQLWEASATQWRKEINNKVISIKFQYLMPNKAFLIALYIFLLFWGKLPNLATYWICRSRLIFFTCNMTLMAVSIPADCLEFWPRVSSSAVVTRTASLDVASEYMASIASRIRWLRLWDKECSENIRY